LAAAASISNLMTQRFLM